MIIIEIITITIDNKYFIYLKQIELKNKKINEKKSCKNILYFTKIQSI